jgi:hypothetical protein
MVLVERPEPVVAGNEVEIDPTPSPNSLQMNPQQQDDLNTNIKFFPNTLTATTDSGLLNVNKPDEITNNLNPINNLPNSNSPLSTDFSTSGNITETEIHKRTIMLLILVVLSIILFFATVLLFLQKRTADTKPIIVPSNNNIREDQTKIIKIDPESNSNPQVDDNTLPAPPTPPETPTINVTETKPPDNNAEDFIPLPQLNNEKKTAVVSVETGETKNTSMVAQEVNDLDPVKKFIEELKDKSKKQQFSEFNDSVVIKPIDVTARLRQPIAGFRYENIPLLKVIRTISELSAIPISLDVDEMRAFGIRIDVAVTGKFGAGNIGEILDKILEPLKLIAVVENYQLTVTVLPDKRKELVSETIDVADIVKGTKDGDQLTAERLVEVVAKLIDPVGFGNVADGGDNADGGDRNNNRNDNKIMPQIRVVGESIFICSYRRKVDEAIRLLEQIRLLRGLQQKTKIIEDDLAPEVFGWDNVDVLVTLNYYQETPLAVIFEQIEKKYGLLITVDYKELHRANLSFDQLYGKLRANNITLNEALEQLLASVDGVPLTYRIVGGNIIELTTTHTAKQPNKMSTEIHRYKKTENQAAEKNVTNNIDGKETAEQIVESIIAVIEPASWKNIDVAKIPNNKGEIIIDRPSSCLIIRQSQPIQRQIRTWLKQQ